MKQPLRRLTSTFREYPNKYWILVIATFIDRLGGTLIGPFFALYITKQFNVGMTEAGVLFAIFSISGLGGNMVGGALADKFGRRGMVLFGLVFSALSSISMGLVKQLSVFYSLAVLVGLLSDVAGPARQAMVADLLPEEKHAEGFGVMRVSANLAWILGPTIGGLLAAKSYLLLFVLDAISSLITAFIVFKLIPETKPTATAVTQSETMIETLIGYRQVIADRLYLGFIGASMLMGVVYIQMYNTLSVYLRDVHGIPERGYGLMLSLNAATVVVLQFWITRRTRGRPPMLMMALGTLLYMVGFTMYGIVSTYSLFIFAMIWITFGEMIVVPVGQALVARFAPEEMRGRYMAFYGLAWSIPGAVGPWAAGLVLDNYNPNWVWYIGGILCALSIVGFLALHASTKARFDLPAEQQEAAAPV
jgi:MFS family permease